MRRSRRKPKLYKVAAQYAAYYLARAVFRLVLLLPFSAAAALGALAGVLAYHFARVERNRAIRHLRLAFGARYSRGERRAVAYRMFRSFGADFAEALAATRLTTEELEKRVVNAHDLRDQLLGVLKEGKGLIAMTGHLGNWELVGSLGARYIPLYVVANRFHFEPFNRLTEALRGAGNMKTIYLNENPREIVRALKGNAAVGILPDQDIRRLPGTYVPFFGRPAWTPVGPVLTAKLSRAPMHSYFLVRKGRKYFVEIGRRIPMAFTGDRKNDLFVNTRRWSERYEKLIRMYPDQWGWNHLRWNTRPDDLPEAFLRYAVLPGEAMRHGADEHERPEDQTL